MVRGTTPTCYFNLPFDTSALKHIRVIFSQEKRCLVKEGDDVERAGSVISVKLSQKETLSFVCSNFIDIQVRVLTNEGDALASDIIRDYVDSCLEDEVLE